MAIEITQLMHAGIRVDPTEEAVTQANEFYGGLLGLQKDAERPHIPSIPGFWVNLKDGDRSQQIHIMGAEGMSPAARSEKHDPTRQHLAFAVRDLDAARSELENRGIEFWVYEGLVGRGSDQVFFEDPFGNVIELQQDPG